MSGSHHVWFALFLVMLVLLYGVINRHASLKMLLLERRKAPSGSGGSLSNTTTRGVSSNETHGL